jgi:hypothetical protein
MTSQNRAVCDFILDRQGLDPENWRFTTFKDCKDGDLLYCFQNTNSKEFLATHISRGELRQLNITLESLESEQN